MRLAGVAKKADLMLDPQDINLAMGVALHKMERVDRLEVETMARDIVTLLGVSTHEALFLLYKIGVKTLELED